MQLITLAIDTSCDETSVAVTCGLEVWSNVIASQTELHKPYGGVFPTVAKLAHQENMEKAVKAALTRGQIKSSDVEQIAITIGPGLAPALEVGIKYAQKLASKLNIPLVPINHIEAHLLSVHALKRPRKAWQGLTFEKTRANRATEQYWQGLKLPALGMVISGGHTFFVLIEKSPKQDQHDILRRNQNDINIDRQPNLKLTKQDNYSWLNSNKFNYKIIGQTIDDAAGEALDKIGRLVNLGYPAGPVIEQFAKLGNKQKYPFPLPMTQTQNYDLSFSGLKTYARNFTEKNWGKKAPSKEETYDFCASVQYSIFRHICYKLSKILQNDKSYSKNATIWLGGGVAANRELRKMLRQSLKLYSQNPKLLAPQNKKLCGDNAGMIGIVATL